MVLWYPPANGIKLSIHIDDDDASTEMYMIPCVLRQHRTACFFHPLVALFIFFMDHQLDNVLLQCNEVWPEELLLTCVSSTRTKDSISHCSETSEINMTWLKSALILHDQEWTQINLIKMQRTFVVSKEYKSSKNAQRSQRQWNDRRRWCCGHANNVLSISI